MRRLLTAVLMVVAALAATTPAIAAVERAREVGAAIPAESRGAADELLELSGLRAQVEILAARVAAEFQLDSTAFDPDVLYARVRETFTRRVEGRQVPRALDWFRSPLARRIVALEVAAIRPGRTDEVRRFLDGLAAERPSPARIALLERLDSAGLATEMSLDITSAILRRIIRASEPLAPASIDDRILALRSRVWERTREASLVGMLFAYRTLTDTELAELVAFVESDAGQWFVGTTAEAVVQAVGAAAEGAAAELARAARHAPRLDGSRGSSLSE